MSQRLTQLLLNERPENPIPVNYIPGYLPPGFFERYHFLNPRNNYSPKPPKHDVIKPPLGRLDLTTAALLFFAYAAMNEPLGGYASGIKPRTDAGSLEDTVNVTPLVNPNKMISWSELLALNPDVVIGDRTVYDILPALKGRGFPDYVNATL